MWEKYAYFNTFYNWYQCTKQLGIASTYARSTVTTVFSSLVLRPAQAAVSTNFLYDFQDELKVPFFMLSTTY